MVGIILAGGTGSRLFPNTVSVSKQLLPIYSVPLLFHPLTFLMKAGIKDFVVITNPHNVDPFKNLLKDGTQWGINIEILPQESPKGIAEAFLIAEPIVKDRDSILILGDNVFYGCDIKKDVLLFSKRKELDDTDHNCKIFGYKVKDPQRYGVIEFDNNKNVIGIEEKPQDPKSNYAAVGLYMCDGSAADRVKSQHSSARGELEITDLMKSYMYDENGGLKTSLLNNGTVWLDAGTKRSYVEAINFVEAIEERTGKMIACPEEVALKAGFIDTKDVEQIYLNYAQSDYRDYLYTLI